MRRFAVLFSAGLSLLAAQVALASRPNRISDIRVRGQGTGTVVEIAGERAPNFTTFKQNNPQRIIVDVAESALERVPAAIQGDGSLVEGVSAYQVGNGAGSISRVVIQLRREAEYRVTVSGGRLLVHLRPGAGGLLVSAGVPLAPGGSSSDDGGRDLALAEELAQPTAVAVSAAGGGEPASESEPAPAVPARGTERGQQAAAPTPPRGVVASSLAQPASPLPVEPADGELPADEAAAGSSAAPRDSRPRPVMVAAVYPRQPGSRSGDGRLLAQQEPAEEGDEVEEVEEVPVEVEEAVPETAQPSPEEGLPPPPPPPSAETEPPAVPAAEEAPPPPPPPPPVEERVDLGGEVRRMTWVGFQQTQESSRVFIKTNAPVKYRLSEEGDRLVVLELENTSIPLRNNRRFLDTHFFDSAVTMITPRELAGVTSTVRIEIELRQRVPYQARQEDNVVYVSFQRPQ